MPSRRHSEKVKAISEWLSLRSNQGSGLTKRWRPWAGKNTSLRCLLLEFKTSSIYKENSTTQNEATCFVAPNMSGKSGAIGQDGKGCLFLDAKGRGRNGKNVPPVSTEPPNKSKTSFAVRTPLVFCHGEFGATFSRPVVGRRLRFKGLRRIHGPSPMTVSSDVTLRPAGEEESESYSPGLNQYIYINMV